MAKHATTTIKPLPPWQSYERPTICTAIACPTCGSNTAVIDSRASKLHKNAIRRRRCCVACSLRFTTYEQIAAEHRAELLKRAGL